MSNRDATVSELHKHRKRPINAIELLRQDHENVQDLIKEFMALDDKANTERFALVQQICRELHVHTRIEEEIFYPALRDCDGFDEMLNEATVEHAGVKQLVRELEVMRPRDELYDAKVTVLGEYIDHHVNEEHRALFPKAEKSGVDLQGLGERLARRKDELMALSSGGEVS